MTFPLSASSWTRSLRPFCASVVFAAALGLSACGGGSSGGSEVGAPEVTPTPKTRAELGCQGVDGQLDSLQATLADRLETGLDGQTLVLVSGEELTALINDVLDLLDATAETLSLAAAAGSSNDPGTLTPVVNQLLCVTGAVGEVLVSVTSSATTPLADKLPLITRLTEIVALQDGLLELLAGFNNTGTIAFVAALLKDTTLSIAEIVDQALGVGSVGGGVVVSGVLHPVAQLLHDLSASFRELELGNENRFATKLVNSVTDLVEGLADNLGPLGVVLTTVLENLEVTLTAVKELIAGLVDVLI